MIEHGALVVDKEDRDNDKEVVINRPPVTAAEWEIDQDGQTVAQENPEYPPDSQVVAVLFVDDLLEHYPDYQGSKPIPLEDVAGAAKYYSFPQPRLKKVGHISDLDPSPDEKQNGSPSEELLQIKDRLEKGGMDVAVAAEDRLIGSKLGETYTIRSDGAVEGNGALREQIEAAAMEVIG